MPRLTDHAKNRLKERFNFSDSDIKNVTTMIHNRFKLIDTEKPERREIKYKDNKIHAVIKNGIIMTCYEKSSYQDIPNYAIERLHDQLTEYKETNTILTKELNKIKEVNMTEPLPQIKSMTIKEVSEILKVNEITVRRATKELFPVLIENGKQTKLNETHVTAIKLRLEKNHPDKNVEVVKTDLEENLIIKQGYELLLKRANSLSKENKILKEQNIKLLPKAQFYDRVASSKKSIDMGEVAKLINIKGGVGRNKLFELLRKENILMNNNQPYQKYIDAGYFKLIEQKYLTTDKTIGINLKTLVYQKGIDFIIKRLALNKESK